ncbi:histone-lysine N-methyltransferase SETMAR-like [Stomoxys calcitrans]|uniref:histone-lysine N-methyltransferase SETMAR-like n=1 Tax=Stomoxys calcitrans TaxID=35570 RepID=UPI0027E22B19|nr:histone-lysine N-methyltransferase SETMAR-like [Stomoxys calcitrans]
MRHGSTTILQRQKNNPNNGLKLEEVPQKKKAKAIQSAVKVVATFFWVFKGILMLDYLQKGKTINSEYYCNLLDQLNVQIREKRPGLQHKKIVFHQDNAPAHKSVLTMAKINELKYELLDHPSNEDAITVENHYFNQDIELLDKR